MIDRVLADLSRHSAQEIAAKLGVADTYVSKLRGGWRPGRVRDDLFLRLSALDPEANTENPHSYEGDDMRKLQGMQEAAMRMLKAVVDLQVEIGDRMRAIANQSSVPVSPSQAAVEDGAAALRAAARGELKTVPSPAAVKKGKRRPA